LSLVEVGTSTLQECQQCGGLWVGKETFESLCANKEEQEAVLSTDLPGTFMVQEKLPATRVYIPCPVCGTLMNRMNFAGCSGVLIDWCKIHGTWFDQKELQQIVQFIQAGGMKKARDREKENLKAELQRLKVQQMELRLQEYRLGSSSTEARGWKEQPDSLLDFLSGLWGTLTKAD
jgi:Zn-finger nucleic acid-binding protein